MFGLFGQTSFIALIFTSEEDINQSKLLKDWAYRSNYISQEEVSECHVTKRWDHDLLQSLYDFHTGFSEQKPTRIEKHKEKHYTQHYRENRQIRTCLIQRYLSCQKCEPYCSKL